MTKRWKLTVYRGRDWGELFDLENDPQELRNLYNDPAHTNIRADLMTQLVQADLEREYMGGPRISGA